MKIPIYKLTINPDDPNTGVEYVALVNEPAIQRNWIAFSTEEKIKFQIVNEEKRVISGALMVADLPIYRKANAKIPTDYYAVFDAETIWQIAQKYFKEKRSSSVNLMHEPNAKVNDVYCFESFIVDSKRGINTPTGFDKLTDGSWFGSFKVDNEQVWEEVKAGTFKGFSVEGFFELEPQPSADEEKILKVIDILNQVNYLEQD